MLSILASIVTILAYLESKNQTNTINNNHSAIEQCSCPNQEQEITYSSEPNSPSIKVVESNKNEKFLEMKYTRPNPPTMKMVESNKQEKFLKLKYTPPNPPNW